MTATETPLTESPTSADGTGPEVEIPPEWRLASLPRADNGLDPTLDGDLGPVITNLVTHLRRNVGAFPEHRRQNNILEAMDSQAKKREAIGKARLDVADRLKTYRPHADKILDLANRRSDANLDYQEAKFELDRDQKKMTNSQLVARRKQVADLQAAFTALDTELRQAEADADQAGTAYRLASAELVKSIQDAGDRSLAERTRRRLLPNHPLDSSVASSGLDDVVADLNDAFTRHRRERAEIAAKRDKARASSRKQRQMLKAALDDLQQVSDDHPENKKLYEAATRDLTRKRARAKAAGERRQKALSDWVAASGAALEAETRFFENAGNKKLAEEYRKTAAAEAKASAALDKAKRGDKKAAKEAEAAEAKANELNPDRKLLEAMGRVRKTLPTGGFDHATVEALENTAKVAIMDKTYESTKRKLVPNFDRLRKVGSKDTSSVQLELGASFDAVFAKVSVTHVTDVEMSVERTGNGKFKASTSVSMKVRGAGKGGVEANESTKLLIKAGVDAGGSLASERTYDTLEDLVTTESSLILAAAMTGKDRRSNRKFMQERAKLLAIDYQNRDMMWKRLQIIGALPATRKTGDPADDPSKWTGTPKRFKAHPSHRVDVVRTTVKTGAINVDGSVTASMGNNFKLGGGLGVTHKEKSSRNYKTVSFIDDILGNDGLQRLHAYKHGANFGFMEYDDNGKFVKDHWGDSGTEALFALGDEIAKVKAIEPDDDEARDEKDKHLDRARTKLMSGLEMLRMEYDGYLLVTNQMEDGQISKSQVNKAQRDHFPDLRKLKGTNPADYIKALSVQYAVMRDLYEKTFPTGDDGKPALPTGDRAALDRFKDDLQTPRMKLTDKQLRDVYGVDAVSDKSRVSSTTFSANFTVGGYFSQAKELSDLDPNDKNGPRKVGNKGGAGVNLSVSYSLDTTVKAGKTTKSASMVVDIGHGGSFLHTDDSPGEREKWVAAAVAKILNRGDFKDKAKKSPGLEAECRKALLGLAASGQRVQFDFAEVHGEMRLKTASASEQKTRKIGFRSSVPTGTPVNVVVGMNVARTKKQVTRIYHASNTLGAVTDAYRSAVRTQGDGTEDTDGWTAFKKNSKLLARMTRQLGSDDALSDDSSASPAKRRSFGMYLQQIKDGQKMKGTDASRRLGSHAESFGMVNETVDWLLDLATSSDDDDKAAATAFIDTYLENQARLRAFARRKQGDPTTEEKKAADTVERALNDLILAKAAKEDRTAADDYKPARGFDTADLNGYIGDKLADHTEKLVRKIVKAENGGFDPADNELSDALVATTSIAKLRKRVLRHYNDDPGEDNYELVKEVLALEYAADTLDDLTMFNDEADKNKAIGMLGADLDDMLKKSKVYVNDMIEADLSRDSDGNLSLTPVIKKGMSKVVKRNMYQQHVKDVMDGITNDATSTSNGTATRKFALKAKSPMMVSDHGDAEIRWSSQMHYDSQARQEYFKKRADKANYWGIGSTAKAKKNLRARDKEKSIGAMLEKVLTARAEQQRRRRQQQKEKARKQASTTGN